MYQKFQDIVAAAQQRSPKRVIAIAAAADEKMVHVAKTVTDMELCDVILVGDEDVLDVLLAEQGLRPEAVTIVDEKNSDRLGLRAVELVSSGKADILVKGKMNTSDFLHAVLGPGGDVRFGPRLREAVCENLVQNILHEKYRDNPTVFVEYYVAFYAAAYLGIIAHWIERGCPESSETMARIAMRLLFIKPGESIEL